MIREIIRTYSELITFDTFEERFNYLALNGTVGQDTFGYDRYLNQLFYRSPEWKRVRDFVIVRDMGCDLGLQDYPIINQMIYIHHINPLCKEDIINSSEFLLDPEYLICTCRRTHDAIHYGDPRLITDYRPVTRKPNDQCPWKH